MLFLRAGFADKCNCNYSIFITFKYNPSYVELMKTFKQRSWNNERKEWEIGQDSYNDLMNAIQTYNIPYNVNEYRVSVEQLKEQVANMQAIRTQEANVDASVLDNVEFKTKPFSESTLTSLSFVIVTLSLPMLPAILLPLITRLGVVPAPIEPGSL